MPLALLRMRWSRIVPERLRGETNTANQLVVRDSVAVGANVRRFMRVRVVRP